MFGYVTVSKTQLTDDEYKTFCAYYCGVCRAMGRRGSQLSRLGLSYDITFLALVLSSMLDGDADIADKHCFAHPIQKRSAVMGDIAVEYAAAVGVILDHLKLADDLHDRRSIAAAVLMALTRRGYRRAGAELTAETEVIKRELGRLSGLERQGCRSADEAADTFAKLLERMFTPDFIKGTAERRALAWLGYNIGRWIYLIDAYNDMDDDRKTGAYNVFLADGRTPDEVRSGGEAELSLTLTLANIASAFELLDIKKNKSIIGKMIYISLKQKQAAVLNGADMPVQGRYTRCAAGLKRGCGGGKGKGV